MKVYYLHRSAITRSIGGTRYIDGFLECSSKENGDINRRIKEAAGIPNDAPLSVLSIDVLPKKLYNILIQSREKVVEK